MRRTLSQPSRPPNSLSRGGFQALFVGLSLALTALAAGGCNRIEGESQAGALEAGDATSPTSDEAFAWPTDPEPPLLRIEIEGAGVEGRIEIELMPELAPETIRQIRILAAEGFYDGTTFHRVIPEFMIQGGDPNSRDRDPNNDGHGGPGFTMPDEFTRAPFERGVVGMGNKGRVDSNGSQFFIMHADIRSLDGRYTVIGRVRSGMDLVDAITTVEIDRYGRWGPKNRPIENIVMSRVRVWESTDGAAVAAEIDTADAIETNEVTSVAEAPREAPAKSGF
jgi:peptidyl-prolyl cis-trans isomerase B (cyclophilin B)